MSNILANEGKGRGLQGRKSLDRQKPGQIQRLPNRRDKEVFDLQRL
jgi:hypothetical protein